MTETSTKKTRLVYFKTGNPYSDFIINGQDGQNTASLRVGSLHQFLLRNTNLKKFEISNYHYSEDRGWHNIGYEVAALFYIETKQNELENYEVLGGIDLLTLAGKRLSSIHMQNTIKLYEDTYLKVILGDQLFEHYLVKEDFIFFDENWNLKDYKNRYPFKFDTSNDVGLKDKLGFYEWLFQMLKQAESLSVIYDDTIFPALPLYYEKTKNIKYSENNYMIRKPNIGK